MKIKKTIEKVPGGMMIIPLVQGAAANTLAPDASGTGGFTPAPFKEDVPALIGVFLLCMRSVKALPQARVMGGGIIVTKCLAAVALGLSVDTLSGPEGRWGLSSVAVIAAMDNSNGGLHTVPAGAAARTTAITPAALAQADPALSCVVAAATPLIATSVIVTALLTPMLTFLGGKR
ncbi:hypothetical protein HA47_13545 [Pantoea stewartii subsp. indologenes]|nr:hypothetical protein HA47_13545 [Pantoea stewartii subsp. indologenes]PXV76402.1 2-keto-3-deoxygluconate permease [Pantoea sp. PNA 03-3]